MNDVTPSPDRDAVATETGAAPVGFSLAALVRGMRESRDAVLPVVLVAIAGIGLYVFFGIADEVVEGEMRAFDDTVFRLFRSAGDLSDPIGPPWLEEAAVEITALGGFPVLAIAVLAVAGLLLVTRQYGPAFFTVASVWLGTLMSSLLKEFYARPRPDLVEHLDTVHTSSFPSGHAMVGTVVYLTLATLVVRFFDDRRVRVYVMTVAILLAVAIGVTRIYLGVHWPSDVVAGWALGAAWASLAWLTVSLIQFLRRRRRRRDERP